jgi:1-acyl-sn-glycerol-3-phosphate acyltransferase
MMHASQALAPPCGTTWISEHSDIGCRTIPRAPFDLRAEGLEKLPPYGAAILAPNHVRNVELAMIGISVSRRVHFTGKEELRPTPDEVAGR